MLRMLRLLAAISCGWMVGVFLLRLIGGEAILGSFASVRLLSTLGGELGFVVGILALVVTASRREFAWFTLFALLVALLHVLPLLIFQTPPYPTFLALFEAPPELLGSRTWVLLLPALLPGAAFIYTLITQESRPVVGTGGASH